MGPPRVRTRALNRVQQRPPLDSFCIANKAVEAFSKTVPSLVAFGEPIKQINRNWEQGG